MASEKKEKKHKDKHHKKDKKSKEHKVKDGGVKKEPSAKTLRRKEEKRRSELRKAAREAERKKKEQEGIAAAAEEAAALLDAAAPRGFKHPRPIKQVKPKGPKPQGGDSSKADKMSGAEYKALQQAAATVASEPLESQAEFLWQHCKRVTKATSDLERVGLSAEHMVSLPQPSTSEADLEGRIFTIPGLGKALGKTPNVKGTPLVLIIGADAARVNGAIKLMPTINKSCRVAKLFSRHFKVPEQVKLLQENELNVAVCTPNRVLKLVEVGALKLDRLRLVLLDIARDVKQRTLLDLPETAQDFWTLYKTQLAPRIQNKGIECRVGLIELPPVQVQQGGKGGGAGAAGGDSD